MTVIIARLIIEDTCNPSDQKAREYVEEILNEAFGKEEMKEHPRVKLVLMEIKHTS